MQAYTGNSGNQCSWFNKERFSDLKILNSHKERMDRLSFLDIANEILVFLKYLMYSQYQPLFYYFTFLLYFLYTVELTVAQATSLDFWVIYNN